MYDGMYSAEETLSVVEKSGIPCDVRIWLLSSRIHVTEFQNYAMSRLYATYAALTATTPVTTTVVEFVSSHSTPDSSLYTFFKYLTAIHFLDKECMPGIRM
jgi:hypothetical protein